MLRRLPFSGGVPFFFERGGTGKNRKQRHEKSNEVLIENRTGVWAKPDKSDETKRF